MLTSGLARSPPAGLWVLVQWNHACFGVRGVSKRTSSNPVHDPSEEARPTIGLDRIRTRALGDPLGPQSTHGSTVP
ncbi:hypothetical protein E2C01_057691 [Portunus trituberculatus]|uniref:Uncharacterized protein n=1 Tax=Portunus trituberculatus TaxID=210409 RepID=A0A5B7GTM9_PORTR|nr:hypothetical protein [Portunus trituberculatus]